MEVYAATSLSSEDVNRIYFGFHIGTNIDKTHYNILMGVYNAKVNFVTVHYCKVINTYFKKKGNMR